MTDNYKISICVSVYNVEKYIERCAVSLFEQTYDNLEFIIVNDNTPDNSIAILKSVIERYPERKSQIKIIHHSSNRGIAVARNTAIDNCTGRFMMFVDADDYIDIDCVSIIAQNQIKTNADIVTCNALMHTYDGVKKFINPFYVDKNLMLIGLLSSPNNHMIWGRLIKHDLYVLHHIKAKEGVNFGEDWQLLIKLVYYSNIVSSVDDFLYNYNCMNEKSLMAQKRIHFNKSAAEQDLQSLAIIEDFFRDKDEKYQIAIMKCKGIFFEKYLDRAYKAQDVDYYNFFVAKLLAIDKRYLFPIGWDKFKIRLINRNYYLHKIFDHIFSLYH